MISATGKKISVIKAVTLAPMAGVGDISFRRICTAMGAELTVSEMVSAKGLHFKDKKTAQLAFVPDSDVPTSVQIFGSDPDTMAEAAELITTGRCFGQSISCVPFAIDINMGCPVRKVVSSGDGSALMRNPSLAGEIIKAVSSATALPVTVKIRAGWDDSEINAPAFALIAEEAGANAICVHGRTRAQMYSPPVNLDVIRDVKSAVSIPVIGNGGIFSAEDAIRMFEYTGCDGVAIARGAEGNPYIFKEIAATANGKPYSPPSEHERAADARRHVEMVCDEYGEEFGVLRARKIVTWYMRGLRGVSALRAKIMTASSLSDIYGIIDNFENNI